MKPTVLVGIVTKNRASILPQSIASALAQQGCEVRVSVIDDASTDDTDKVSEMFPQVEWIRWNPNRGYMAARNHWMMTAKEDYFVSLDDDAWFLQQDEIAKAVELLESQDSVAAVAYDILSPDRPDSVPRSEAFPVAMFIGCGHVLKLDSVRKVGFYEKTPGSYGGEEKDLCLRLMDAGSQIVLMPGFHVWHDKTLVARDIQAQHRSGVCNDLVITLRRTPLFLLPLALMGKLYRHLHFSMTHRLAKSCVEGVWMFVQAIPQVIPERRSVRMEALREFMRLSRRTDLQVPMVVPTAQPHES